ncbi:MAG: CDP-glycerol glycerophosphotransferase [Methanobacteriaceae archaeon]|nr:CDP-glycerol glycerophosphotransferase [Methanobacteriaceae archaeon]
MNSWIGKGLTSILKFINRLIPKRNDQILFESIPNFSDNPMQLYNYIKSLNEGYRLYWIVDELRGDIDAPQYKRNTIGELWQFLRSKYIVTSHGHHLFLKAKNQVYVNLWHGMPLKAMGYAQNNPKILPPNSNDNNYYLIATSTIMRNALAACFNQDPRRIFVTGQPRNDKLSKDCPLDLIRGYEYNAIILYAPTYRENGSFFFFPDFDKGRFQKFLKEHNILFIVKPHPLEETHAIKIFKKMENIILLEDQMLQERHLDIYDFLPCTDILVTDYSSVYFDFLLLDKPILFAVPDLEEYRKKRGFVLEPFEFWTPGPKVKNFKEFLEEIKKSIKDPDYYSQERRTINDLVNYYKDDRSSKRVYELVWGSI